MATRRLLALSAVLVGVGVFVACADDETKLGPPDGLQGKQPIDRGAGGATPDAAVSGGGDGAVSTGCTPPGTPGAECTSTFTADIYPNLFTTAWTCANAACHVAGGTPPDLSTAEIAYTSVTTSAASKHPANTGKPYVNTGCKESTESSIITCLGTAKHMPLKLAGNHTATADEITKLTTWIACGSPK